MTWILILTASLLAVSEAVRVHFVHWNSTNPLFFRGQNVIDINSATSPWDYEQANIICPYHPPNVPRTLTEEYIVYNVTKEEYEQCKLDSAHSAKIVAVCNTPYEPKFFTLTFRSFSPTPGAFEFHPGEKYYFISTQYVEGRSRRSRSLRCSHPPMRLIFRIKENEVKSSDSSTYEEPVVDETKPDSYVTDSQVFTPREMPMMTEASMAVLTTTFTVSCIFLPLMLLLL